MRIGAVVLAAGLSTRMGRNKLLIEIGGRPLIAHAAMAALGAGLEPVVVVTGHEADGIRRALKGMAVSFAHNPRHGEGLAGSLVTGLGALPGDVDGVVVCLGDMPGVTALHIGRLVAAFAPADGGAICVPVFAGRRGNPVLFARAFFPEMMNLTGDVGARAVIARHADRTRAVAMDDDGVLADVDTAESLAAFEPIAVLR